MKKLLAFFVVAALLAGCTNEQSGDQKKTPAEKEQTATPQIELASFNDAAGEYVDKKVAVTGIVDHVCKHGGKKILLVADGADLHINSDKRFDDEIQGSKVEVTGIVREERIDESDCLQMEEDNIQSHKTGETDESLYERKQKQITFYRDSMEKAGVDHLSFYSLEYIDHTEKK